MDLIGEAPRWAAIFFFVLLALAAAEDGWRLRIANRTVLALLLLGLLAAFLVGLDLSLWQNFAILIGLLILGTPLHSMGWMGGGDVKLLAATGFWFTPTGALHMLIAVLIAGGLLTVLVMGLRMAFSRTGEGAIGVIRKGGGIPYGIAIAVGAAGMALSLRGLW
ncbi:A24 family peptidase [Sphingomicrobium lutaoense]|uniref:Prepilin peptidase CpaA n=1 Tax=Sphingomicrobium lutaoense TaxID=515949 RepID=A0A839Z4Z4_9SPHN|nr:prepilin peptidase [Sphingomicrobium lutaoense]MBB3764682.1 prepilin peptidase CpaA [Sphingomicrobium lutaoense]